MAQVRKDQIHTEAINRGTKLALATRAKLLDAWGAGPMVQRLTPAQMRAKLNRDPVLRQQMVESVGLDKTLELLLSHETLKLMGVK